MDQAKEERFLFSREEIAKWIYVPKIVENDLTRIIEERLEKCGLYHRVFSRIKSIESLHHKYQFKEYDENKKIQDLVGIRIDMYFEDDLAICQRILERTFELVEWSNSEAKEEEFKATKINGVFRLPQYLKNKISAKTWEMGIDDTFEIQLKTMFFEGWHEIEHDMRYKQDSIWQDRPSFSRYFNSILATLELCDKSMVNLFEDLGHDLYKAGQWEDMIKVHFRVKLENDELYPEVKERFNQSYRSTVDNLAKRLFKTNRARLIDMLLKRNYPVPINVNTIVALMNESMLHDDQLRKIFKKHDVYNIRRMESRTDSNTYLLKPLLENKVFQARVKLDTDKYGIKQTFTKAAGYVYQWILNKFGELIPNMPDEIEMFYGQENGYNVGVIYDEDAGILRTHTVHIDLNVAGRMWTTQVELMRHEKDLVFTMASSYMEPEGRNTKEQGLYFSYPRFYREIVDNIGIIDVTKCVSSRKIIRDAQVEMVSDLILEESRLFPVILILSEEDEDGMMDERWLGQLRVSDFIKSVWRYSHVYTGYAKSGKTVLNNVCCPGKEEWKEDKDTVGIYIFWSGYAKDKARFEYYTPMDVRNCSFGGYRGTRNEMHSYDIVKGGQAFYHKLLMRIKDNNVSLDVPIVSLKEKYRTRKRIMASPDDNAGWKKLFSEYNAYNEELLMDNQNLRAQVEKLQKELFQMKHKEIEE